MTQLKIFTAYFDCNKGPSVYNIAEALSKMQGLRVFKFEIDHYFFNEIEIDKYLALFRKFHKLNELEFIGNFSKCNPLAIIRIKEFI